MLSPMQLLALLLMVAPGLQSTGAAPQVQLEALDGTLKSQPAAAFATRDPRELGAHVVYFPTASEVGGGGPAAAEVVLHGGQRWVGALRGASEESVEITFAPAVKAEAVIDEILSVTFPGRLPPEWTGTLARAAEGDRLYRVQGRALDVIDGALEGFSAEGVVFDGARIDSRTFAWSEVAALFIDSIGPSKAERERALAVPVLVDLAVGGRVRGELLSCAGEQLELGVQRGQKLVFPFALVRQLFVDDGRARYLSELEPSSAEPSRPFGDDLGLAWLHRVDRSVSGRPLTAQGRVHTHGLGVHAPSKLAWTLDAGWKTLRGRVAIDDEVKLLPSHGSVIFRVLLDGKQVWESPLVRGGEEARAFGPLDLGSAKQLTLEVDPGPDSFVADRADWLEVLLVR